MTIPARRRSRLLSVPLAGLVATAAVLVLSSPSIAQVPNYVEQGGTVQLIPASTCGVPTNAGTVVQPTEAGTLNVGSNGCGLSFTASSTYLGTALGGVQGVSTTFGFIVVAAGTGVVQGDTVEVVPASICGIPTNSQTAVIPTQAGTAFIGANGCGFSFTASRTYVGPVDFGFALPGGGPGSVSQFSRTVLAVPPNFVKPTARASGSFTPVAPPPPPGPCILVTANPVVSFGDVTLGGPYRNGDVAPTVAGCAAPAVAQDVLVQASIAASGATTLPTDTSCLTPVNCDPPDGTYSLALPDDALTVRSTPTVWQNARPGDFPDEGAALAVRLPATLAPSYVGNVFTFDVTFTAVID